jgi:glycerol-3-phosphate O-acyltransferase
MSEPQPQPPAPEAPQPPDPGALVPVAPGFTGTYGPFARFVLRTLFHPVAFPAEAIEPLRELSQRATLVYVLRSSALLHLLFFNWTFSRLGLPVARAATGLGYRIFKPFARWYLGGSQVKAPAGATVQVIAAVRQGEAALVFLRMPRTLPSAVARLADPFPALVELQRERPDKPIALVPLTFLWRKRPRQLRGGVRDLLFGDPEEPGAIRSAIGFLINRRSAFVKVGEPVDLHGVNAMQTGAEPGRVARRVRGFLHQHLARETRVVTGPPLKAPDRVVEETLRDLELRRTLAEIARERGRADGSVEREAQRDLREIAARYSPTAIDFIKGVLHIVFNRIYDGIDVDEPSMRRLVEASARGPLILCPCHKSHIDYMVLSYICDDYGLQPPHVAAGDNLNFFPVGRLLRAAGAFFIRRSFKGDRVYQATMAAYVRKLLRDGFTQEFFVEGGRSRTGKLLPPKFGMLALEVDAWLTGVRPDAFFAPVSISYEKIAEGASYQRELLGGEKQKEDAKALLSATKVLRSRYGRITIRADEPISLSQLFRERGVEPLTATAEDKRKLVQALGLRIAAGINRAAPLAPMGLVCAVLLSHDLRALSEDDLFDRAEFLHTAALDLGARSAKWSRELGLRAVESLCADGSLKRHEAGGERFYAVQEERRIALDYHKNSILHFLVAPAILADALRSFHGQPAPVAELMRRAKDLSRLFKHEFIYEPGRSFEVTVDETFARMLQWGVAEKKDEFILPAVSGARMTLLLSELLRPFGEGVWAAVDSLSLLEAAPLESKEWVRQALDRGRAAYLAGRILRYESLSKATLENAVAMLRDRGVLLPQNDSKKLELTPAFRDPARLSALADEVDLFLR